MNFIPTNIVIDILLIVSLVSCSIFKVSNMFRYLKDKRCFAIKAIFYQIKGEHILGPDIESKIFKVLINEKSS